MNNVNYSQIYQRFTKSLNSKTKDIFDRRFGVKTGNPETLEAIGKTFGITRERVRQIEEAGFNVIRKNNKENLDAIFANFEEYFKEHGGFQKEENVLEELGILPAGRQGKKAKPYVLFLLTMGVQFSRVCEKKDFHYFWSNLPDAQAKVRGTLNSLVSEMKKVGKPITSKDFYAQVALKQGFSEKATMAYLDVSKRIQSNKEGELGLVEWPEIKPRGVKDKAYLVFKQHQKPLHFREVAGLIDKLEYGPNPSNPSGQAKKTYPQTVHNELIKDGRFVLVGRGTYALSEWGYVSGTIKDVITKVLSEKGAPIEKDELVKQVLAQRLVAKNTILMNLNNKKYFEKDGDERYFLKKTQTA